MKSRDQGVASALDGVVAGAAGVSSLYRSGGLLGRALAAGKDALHTEGEPDPYVDVRELDGRLAVAVTVGVDADSATDACRGVHDAIAAWLRENGHADASIRVTVAHVAG